jgi:hypothetical protein
MTYNPNQLVPPERSLDGEEEAFCEICDGHIIGDDIIHVNKHTLCDDYACMMELAWMIDNELHDIKARVDAMIRRLTAGL